MRRGASNEVLKINNTVGLGLTKKAEEDKAIQAQPIRDDRIKKIHKPARKGKPNGPRPALKQSNTEQPEDPLKEIFERIYNQKHEINNLLARIEGLEETINPEQLSKCLSESMTRAISFYKSSLNLCCIKILHQTLRSSDGLVTESLEDLTMSRTNLLQDLKCIHDSFVQIILKNQQVSEIISHIASRNPAVSDFFNDKMTVQSVNYEFFKQLMAKNDFLKGISQFAETLVAEEGFEIAKQQKDQLRLIIDCSQLKPKSKRSKKKKKQQEKMEEMTEKELQEKQQQLILKELEVIVIPQNRLSYQFDDELLQRLWLKISNGR